MRARVIESARSLGLELELRQFESSAATASETAVAVGCAERQVALSRVFIADGDPVLCIVSGSRVIDSDLLADALDAAEIRQATPHEAHVATGFRADGLPPVGHGLPVVLDERILQEDSVWAAGGDGHSLVKLDPLRLVGCIGAQVARVTD